MTNRIPEIASIVFLISIGSTLLAGCRSLQAPSADAPWVREELYFGSDIPTGGVVTDSLWEDFVGNEIVARFPDGFTTIPAIGRYRYSTGEIKKEPTRIIVIFYPSTSMQDSLKVDEVIRNYKTQFSQESVLRVRSKTEARFQ